MEKVTLYYGKVGSGFSQLDKNECPIADVPSRLYYQSPDQFDPTDKEGVHPIIRLANTLTLNPDLLDEFPHATLVKGLAQSLIEHDNAYYFKGMVDAYNSLVGLVTWTR